MDDDKKSIMFRDEGLDKLLEPLKRESIVTKDVLKEWQSAVSRELAKPPLRKNAFFAWGDTLKIAAGIVLGIGIGAAAFHKTPVRDEVQNNNLAFATVQHLSAKASD